MTETPLDRHHIAAEAGDETARLRFWDRLISAELFVVLEQDAQGDQITPQIFNTDDGDYLLVFDTQSRLAEFVARPAPNATLSGRHLVDMITGQGFGIALNPGVAVSSQLIPAAAVDWLAAQLVVGPEPVGGQPTEISAPGDVPEALLTALDEKLAGLAGMARLAYLVSARFGARNGHLLAIIDAAPQTESALATAIAQTLALSGLEAASLDVAFFDASDEMAARLARVGLRFDLPEIGTNAAKAPGSDPDKPPRLR